MVTRYRVTIFESLDHEFLNQSHISGVDFVSGGQPLSLIVLLPPDFPKDRPTMFVEPRNVKHPWIRDDGAVVGAPGKES